jgi:UDP-glucuronate 4-epimerase
MSVTRVVITGSGGFIGKNLLDTLANNALYDVHGVDLLPPDAYTHLSDAVKSAKNITLHTGDVGCADLKDIAGGKCVHVVVHLAGSANVRQSDSNPLLYIDNNVRVTTHVLDQCRVHGVKRFVFASSSSVYGSAPPPHAEEIATGRETQSVYGLSKWVGEELCAYYARRYEIETVCLRFFTVYGPHGRPDMAVGAFASAVTRDVSSYIYGDGEQKRSYTYVKDVVDVIVRCCTSPRAKNGKFNVGASESVSVNALMSLVKRVFGRSDYDKVEYIARHAADVDCTDATQDRIRVALGVSPCTSLDEGVRLYAEWLTVHGE